MPSETSHTLNTMINRATVEFAKRAPGFIDAHFPNMQAVQKAQMEIAAALLTAAGVPQLVAELEAAQQETALQSISDFGQAQTALERATKAETALAAMQARWSGMVEQSKQHVEAAKTAQRKAEASADKLEARASVAESTYKLERRTVDGLNAEVKEVNAMLSKAHSRAAALEAAAREVVDASNNPKETELAWIHALKEAIDRLAAVLFGQTGETGATD